MKRDFYKRKHSKYQEKYLKYIQNGCGPKKKATLAGMIFSHGIYIRGGGLCVIPQNITIVTLGAREKPLLTKGKFQGRGDDKYQFLNDHDSRLISMTNKETMNFHNIYNPGSVIENLSLDFRVTFDNNRYSLAGIITRGRISFENLYKNLPSDKKDNTWIDDSLSAHDTNIIEKELLKEQIIENRATYMLSDILKIISDKYNKENCVFLLHTCRSNSTDHISNLLQNLTELIRNIVGDTRESLEDIEDIEDAEGDMGKPFRTTDFNRINSDILIKYDLFQKIEIIKSTYEQFARKFPIPARVETNEEYMRVKTPIHIYEYITGIEQIILSSYRISMEDFKKIDDIFNNIAL
jgi:hypothetical protein